MGSLVRSLAIVGSANLVTVVLGVIRVKLIAVFFGAAGVGLWGIYSNFLNTLSTGAGLGIPTSAVQKIAASPHDKKQIKRILFVVSTTVVFQGIIAVGLVSLYRTPISYALTQSEGNSVSIFLVALAALFAMLSLAQMSILQGQRQLALMSKATVLGAVAGTICGIGILLTQHPNSIVLFIMVQPICGYLAMAYFAKKAPFTRAKRVRLTETFAVWRSLAGLGIPLMLGVFIQMSSLLVVRAIITRQLGLVEAGLFAASWTVTMHYVGFLFNAMGADYYPRLSEHMHDPEERHNLVNRQMQLGLMIGTPILLLMMTLAPWIIAIFYTADFYPVSDVLRWQIAGNFLKLASWPLAFILIAAKMPKQFLAVEILWNGLFLGLVWFGIGTLGLAVTGFGFLICYAVYFVVLWAYLKMYFDLSLSKLSIGLLCWSMACACVLLVWVTLGLDYILVPGLLSSICSGLLSILILARQIGGIPKILQRIPGAVQLFTQLRRK